MRCRKCDFDGEGLRALLIKRETDLASTRIALEKSQHELAELLEAHQTMDTQLIRERDTARAALEDAQAKITAARDLATRIGMDGMVERTWVRNQLFAILKWKNE